jgi:hypothetical protein
VRDAGTQRGCSRIGINIGDIIVEGDDIYGDGVNIAARLEGLAEPGGICVSRNVFSQVKNKVEVGFEDLGDQQVKNIEEPVRIYKVTTGPCERLKGELAIVAGATACGSDKPSIATSRRSRSCPSTTCRATASRSISPTGSPRTSSPSWPASRTWW